MIGEHEIGFGNDLKNEDRLVMAGNGIQAPASVAIFCGARAGSDSVLVESTRGLARELAGRGIRVVYGGGRVGLMGVAAESAMEAGGEVVGVIPEGLMRREVADPRITALHVVASMHERKKLMYELADAFLVLPGGIGTMDEFFEILTWAQLGLHDKPIVIVNWRRFFDPLIALLEHMITAGFLDAVFRSWLLVVGDGEDVFAAISNHARPPLPDAAAMALRAAELPLIP